jgi:uncharacterized repeat protein (TIGR04052 family)
MKASALLLLPLLGATTAASCAAPDDVLRAVEIPFSAVVGEEAFACDGTYALGAPAAEVQPIDLRLYVHDFAVLSDGERVPLVLDDDEFQGSGVALLDFEDDSGACETGSPAVHTSVTGAVPQGTGVDGVSFRVGVPEDQNHLDAATAPAPLNVPGLWWSWVGGYKFMKIDVAAPANPEFYFHLGATTCEGDPADGFSCAHGNIATVDVEGDAVEIDLARLYQDVDVNEPLAEGDAVPGCMAFEGDPECPAMFAALGLGFEGGSPASAQTLFRSTR